MSMHWIRAMRPKTLIASISPVWVGSVMAIEEGSFNLLLFFFSLLTALGIQITTNLANDYYDFIKGADTSARRGPIKAIASGALTLIAMKRASMLSLLITGGLGLYLIWEGGLLIALLLALSLLLAFWYTAGPLPLAYLGLGDLFVLIFFGPVTVASTYFLQTKLFSFQAILIGLGVGALSTAILTINNLRDEEEDRRADKKTLIVRFGQRWGRWEYLCCILLATFIPCVLHRGSLFHLITTLIFLPALFLIHSVFTIQEHSLFHPLLAKTARLLLLYTLLFSIGWML
jgi:1,4-dihydroxy-2-naphthoate polyprenyltransferase